MDMDYIQIKFLRYTNIVSWCESYAKENGCKTSIRLVDHKTHQIVTTEYVADLLYRIGVPAFRNSYNLRSFNKDKVVFYLTVKGASIALICDFIYPVEAKIQGDYKVEADGQLSFVL